MEKKYKIKKDGQPIAMPCTQEQWEALKPELDEIEGVDDYWITDDFINNPMLVNDFNGTHGKIANIRLKEINKRGRTYIDTHDKEAFINSVRGEPIEKEAVEQAMTKEELQKIYWSFYEQLPDELEKECKANWDYEHALSRRVPNSVVKSITFGFPWRLNGGYEKWGTICDKIEIDEIQLKTLKTVKEEVKKPVTFNDEYWERLYHECALRLWVNKHALYFTEDAIKDAKMLIEELKNNPLK